MTVKRRFRKVKVNSKPGSAQDLLTQVYSRAFCAEHSLFKYAVWTSTNKAAILGRGDSAQAAWNNALANHKKDRACS
jgi:hypothetical protein